MKIKINDIESFRKPESFRVDFDNRVERHEIIDRVAVSDYDNVEEGIKIYSTALFYKDDAVKILELYKDKTKVNFTDEAGIVYTNMRLIVKSYNYQSSFTDYYSITFELWAV